MLSYFISSLIYDSHFAGSRGKKHKDTSKVEENLIEENLKIIVWKKFMPKMSAGETV